MGFKLKLIACNLHAKNCDRVTYRKAKSFKINRDYATFKIFSRMLRSKKIIFLVRKLHSETSANKQFPHDLI